MAILVDTTMTTTSSFFTRWNIRIKVSSFNDTSKYEFLNIVPVQIVCYIKRDLYGQPAWRLYSSLHSLLVESILLFAHTV